MYRPSSDLTEELMDHHRIDDDIWTGRNLASLRAWLETQLPEGVAVEDVEFTGIPFAVIEQLVADSNG